MGASVRPIRSTTGRCHIVWSCAVLLAFVAGCAETPKDNKARSSTPRAAEKMQGAKSEQHAAAPAAQPATPAAAEPVQPVGQKDGTEKPPTADAGKQPAPEIGPDVKVSTEAEQEALAQMILAQATAIQKANAEKASQQLAPQVKEPLKPEPATQPAPGSQPTAKPGCGATGEGQVDLTPPAPDQPQPKLVVKEPKVKVDKLWAGQQAVFKFEVANEGEGPLAIRLRGG